MSMEESQFTLENLVEGINENRRRKDEKRNVSSESVDRILTKLWLPLGLTKTELGNWKRGTGPIKGMISVDSTKVSKIIEYAQIDATPSEIGKWIELGEEPTTHKAYVCYPYRDNPIRRSMELLVLLIYLYPKAKESFVPATPHEMYWGLEERSSRQTAMTECAGLIKKCDFVLYFLKKKDAPSSGMKEDMKIAKELGKEVKYIEDLLGYYPNIAETMEKSGLAEFINVPKIMPALVTR